MEAEQGMRCLRMRFCTRVANAYASRAWMGYFSDEGVDLDPLNSGARYAGSRSEEMRQMRSKCCNLKSPTKSSVRYQLPDLVWQKTDEGETLQCDKREEECKRRRDWPIAKSPRRTVSGFSCVASSGLTCGTTTSKPAEVDSK